METITSKDGSVITYTRSGSGPVIILIDGALAYSGAMGLNTLAPHLAEHFTAISYDRRGRGASTDALQKDGPANIPTDDRAVQREVEDIEALIDAHGGSAYLYSISSGTVLAMEAALRLGGKVRGLAMYEMPVSDDPASRRRWKEYVTRLGEMIAAGRNGDAVASFMMLVGASAENVARMRGTPMFDPFEAVAPTLAYDHIALLGEEAEVPLEKAARLRVPTLVMAGEASFPFMLTTAAALAEVIPNAHHCTLPGQTHDVANEAVAPLLIDFLKGS